MVDAYHSSEATHPVLGKLPAYFATRGYKNPQDLDHSPFQYAHNTEDSFFQWLQEHPRKLEAFNLHMSGYNEGRPQWMDPGFYPVADRLSGVPKDEVLLVDVGGGMGHDLRAFKARYPQMPGSLVLQDQKDVIEQMPQCHPALEATVYDFFEPQPIKGGALPMSYAYVFAV